MSTRILKLLIFEFYTTMKIVKMGKICDFSSEKAVQIEVLFRSGVKKSDIAIQLNISKTSVTKILQRFNDTGHYS